MAETHKLHRRRRVARQRLAGLSYRDRSARANNLKSLHNDKNIKKET